MCWFFQKGTCKYGEKCHRPHVKVPAAEFDKMPIPSSTRVRSASPTTVQGTSDGKKGKGRSKSKGRGKGKGKDKNGIFVHCCFKNLEGQCDKPAGTCKFPHIARPEYDREYTRLLKAKKDAEGQK